MATKTKKFGLDNPKVGDTFQTSVSTYEYKMKGGRLQPVRIGSATTKVEPSPSGDVIVDTTKTKVDPSKGGSIQATYPASSTTPSLIKTKETSSSPTVVSRNAHSQWLS